MTRAHFGRATQARFILDAHLHGLLVSIPFDSLPGYDVIVDNRKRLWRVQVKGSTVGRDGRYSINIRNVRQTNRLPSFDICAVWMARENRWAFLPRSVRRRVMVRLTANGKFSHKGWEIFL